MGFSVEDKTIKIDKDGIPDELKKSTGGTGSYLYELLDNWNEGVEETDKYIETYMSNEFNYGGIDIEFDFSIESTDTTIELDIKKVKTEGPILGFLGLYLDTASGKVLLSNTKSKEFISAFDYYKYLRDEHNIYMNQELMLSLLEMYKMSDKYTDSSGDKHEIRLSDLAEIINKNKRTFTDRSMISVLLNENNLGSTDDVDEVDLFTVLEKLSYVIRKIYFKATESWGDKSAQNIYPSLSVFGSEAVNFVDNIKDMEELCKANSEVFQLIVNQYSGLKSEEEKKNHVLRNLSSMLHAEFGRSSYDIGFYGSGRSRDRDFYYEDLNKTESRVINMYDIAEELQDDTLLDLDDVVIKASSDVSKKELRAVEEKIGVSEYISGATLAHLSKGLKNASEELSNGIKNLYRDVEGLGNRVRSTSMKRLTDIVKRLGNFYGRLFKKIDKAMR